MSTRNSRSVTNGRRRRAILGAVLLLSAGTLGCGRNLSGTYVGTETVVQGGMMSGQPSQVTIAIHQMDGDRVSGYWQGQMGMGTIQGRANGDRIDNFSLTMGYGNTGCNVFNGTLFVGGSQLSGMLMATQQQDPNSQYPSGCQASRSVQATLSY